MEGPDWFSSFPAADGRPLLLSAQVTPALGTGADPFPVTTVPTEWLFHIDTAVLRSYSCTNNILVTVLRQHKTVTRL